MNHSIYSADRSTHLKIVVVALVAGIAVAGFGISARTSSEEGTTQTAKVLKAGKPVDQQAQLSRNLAGLLVEQDTKPVSDFIADGAAVAAVYLHRQGFLARHDRSP